MQACWRAPACAGGAPRGFTSRVIAGPNQRHSDTSLPAPAEQLSQKQPRNPLSLVLGVYRQVDGLRLFLFLPFGAEALTHESRTRRPPPQLEGQQPVDDVDQVFAADVGRLEDLTGLTLQPRAPA